MDDLFLFDLKLVVEIVLQVLWRLDLKCFYLCFDTLAGGALLGKSAPSESVQMTRFLESLGPVSTGNQGRIKARLESFRV